MRRESDEQAATLENPPLNLERARQRERVRGLLDLSPGSNVKIGRFTLLERVGAGGMGVVYAAYDPRLDRKIALKMIRGVASASGSEGTAQARLLREAQAIARLSHPNVVSVFDAGTFEDRVYMAYELVEGRTLREWMKQEHRLADVLDVFLQAGAGLVAAHRAGLIHRDFKPDNVLIDKDGRAKVLDFGLARTDQPTRDPSGDNVDNDASQELTQAGTVVGTPAYMSPEQLAGSTIGATSDQFSFCVALFEALYGRRPFEGSSTSELAERIQQGPPAPPPSDVRVPGRIRRAVSRGLSHRAAERWADMPELLRELERARSRKWPLYALGVTLGLVLAGEVWSGLSETEPDPCRAGSEQLMTVWNEARAREVEASFGSVSARYAPATSAVVRASVDSKAATWVAVADENCRATRVEHRQSQELFLRRGLCLERQLREMQALVELFASGDASALQHAAEAAEGLPSAEACDADALAEPEVSPPRDVEVAREVKSMRIDLATASALVRAYELDGARAIVEPIVNRSRALGYAPLEAEASLVLGNLQSNGGQPAAAEQTLLRAIRAAEEGAHDRVAADAWLVLTRVIGVEQARYGEAERLLEVARGAVARLGVDDERRADVLTIEGMILRLQGRYQQALAVHERALELQMLRFGADDPRIVTTLDELAQCANELGDHDAAIGHANRAVAVLERTRGPWHPRVATSLGIRTSIHESGGEHDELLADYARVLAINETVLGPLHPGVAAALHNIGNVHMGSGSHDQAIDYYRRALWIDERASVESGAVSAPSRYGLAMALARAGAAQEAESLLLEVLENIEPELGPTHPKLSFPLLGLAQVSAAHGQAREGIEYGQRALDCVRSGLAADHPRVAEVEFEVAKVLWIAGLRARGLSLARQAHAVFAADSAYEGRASEIAAWLATRP